MAAGAAPVSGSCQKKSGREAPIFATGCDALRIENAKLERLADRLGAVDHVQLAKNLLYVVLHRERADLEDGADFEIALAEVDPLQDVLLADREHALTLGLLR